jgi:hypothetical protein
MDMNEEDHNHAVDMLLGSMTEDQLLELVLQRSRRTALQEEDARLSSGQATHGKSQGSGYPSQASRAVGLKRPIQSQGLGSAFGEVSPMPTRTVSLTSSSLSTEAESQPPVTATQWSKPARRPGNVATPVKSLQSSQSEQVPDLASLMVEESPQQTVWAKPARRPGGADSVVSAVKDSAASATPAQSELETHPINWAKKAKPPPVIEKIIHSIEMPSQPGAAPKVVNRIPAVKKTSGMEEKIEGLRRQFERMALEYIRRLEKR